MRRRTRRALPVALLAAALLAAAVGAPAGLAADAVRSALSRAVLGELAFEGLLEEDGPVQLRAGRWTGPPGEGGPGSRPTAALVPFLIARGDLDGDGREDAVVFLQTGAGGSGSFLHLAAVLDRPEGPRPLPAVGIGDRAEVEALEVVGDKVTLDAVVSGPDDALCCPTLRVRRVYAIEGDALREVAGRERGRLHAEALAGTHWRLTRLDAATPVPGNAGIELRFEDGRVAGSGGCNEFHAEVVAGGRDALEIGPLRTTGRTCPAPVQERERRFLEALGRAHRLGFFFGRLELQYDTPAGRTGRLRFVLASRE
jgi:hypothetical protein